MYNKQPLLPMDGLAETAAVSYAPQVIIDVDGLELQRCLSILSINLNDHLERYVDTIRDKFSAHQTCLLFSPDMFLGLPLSFQGLVEFIGALQERIRQYNVEPPYAWQKFVDEEISATALANKVRDGGEDEDGAE